MLSSSLLLVLVLVSTRSTRSSTVSSTEYPSISVLCKQ